jgi:beta-mannanase
MASTRYALFLCVAGALASAGALAAGCSSSSSPASPQPDAAMEGAAVSPDGESPGSDAATTPDTSISDAGVSDGALPAPRPPPSLTVLPEAGVYMGAFVDVLYDDAGSDAAEITASEQRFVAAEQLIDRRWVIDNRFYNDLTDFTSDPRTQWDIANDLIPHITWMPYGNGNPLVEYIEGQHDDYLHAEAQKAKALGVQIFMRWGHEMNGNWYPWAGYVNGEGGDGGDVDADVADGGIPSSGPAKYVAAWRHVHDIFVQEGATNVIWVWCPNVNDVPGESWNHWANYYPGDDYVDWVGIDAYNWGNSSSCCIWMSFSELLTGSPYQDYESRKPLMLPETASAEVGGNKAAWIQSMHQELETEFRAIRAVVWFDINKETDWRINSSPSALAAYKAMALDPYFNPQ